MMRSMVAAVITAAFWAAGASAQIMEDPTLPAPRSGAEKAVDARFESAQEGINLILNFEFEAAEAFYQNLNRQRPTSPEGELGLALNGWWHAVAGGSPDVPAVEGHLKNVIRKAKDYTDHGGSRAEALYYSGRANSLLSSYYLIHDKKVQAARAAQRARSYLLKCLEEDPDHHDALLGLGLYHYYADALPRFFKLLGWVFGVRGDADRGLRELRQAVKTGPTTGGEAAYFLTNVLTNFERRPDQGLGYIRWLVQKYPNNHVFYIEYQNALEALGYYAEAELELREAVGPGGRFEGVPSVTLMLGRNLYRQAKYVEGAEVLEAQLGRAWQPLDPVAPWTFYFAGRCRDLLGQRDAAHAHYKRVEKFKTGGNVGVLAEDRRKNPEKSAGRRMRVARGLTRQPDRYAEAARTMGELARDIETGALDSEQDVDVIRFREALSWEEAGELDRAVSVYRRISDETPLRGRAGIGIARCAWRAGEVGRTVTILDSLIAIDGFPSRGLARRLKGSLSGGACRDADEAAESIALHFRDSEAFRVEAVQRRADGTEFCVPLEYRAGVWIGDLPLIDEESRYYYRVDGFRREPDPLSRWEREPDSNEIWSLGASLSTTRGAWMHVSER